MSKGAGKTAQERNGKDELEPMDFSLPKIVSKKNFKNVNSSAPQWPYTVLFSAPRNSGKTYAMVALLKSLYFDTITIYTTTPGQEIYQLLFDTIEIVEAHLGRKISRVGSDPMNLIPVEEFDKTLQNLVIIDDFLLEKSSPELIKYYTRGRHNGISVIYLTQSFFDTPPLIRENSNYFCLFKGINERKLGELKRSLLNSYSDKEKKNFDRLYALACKSDEQGRSYLVIDNSDSVGPYDKKRLRKRWDVSLTKYLKEPVPDSALEGIDSEDDQPSGERRRGDDGAGASGSQGSSVSARASPGSSAGYQASKKGTANASAGPQPRIPARPR